MFKLTVNNEDYGYKYNKNLSALIRKPTDSLFDCRPSAISFSKINQASMQLNTKSSIVCISHANYRVMLDTVSCLRQLNKDEFINDNFSIIYKAKCHNVIAVLEDLKDDTTAYMFGFNDDTVLSKRIDIKIGPISFSLQKNLETQKFAPVKSIKLINIVALY